MSRRFSLFTVFLFSAGLLGLGLRLYLYWVGGHTIPVTTDEALTVLQALDIRAGARPLLLATQPYMFPMEAYWMAPLVNVLPRSALGMRVLVMGEGLMFVGLSLLVLRRMGGWREVWPGLLLVMFPSAYLVMSQTAYSQPTYNSAFILALVAAWIVIGLNRDPRPWDFGRALAGGFFGCLAFSDSMLSLALVVPLALVAVVNSIGKGRWLRLAGYTLGGAAGLIPHLAALWEFPGAHDPVATTHGWSEAIGRLWAPTVAQTLPGTFGWRVCLFPDSLERLDWGGWGYAAFPFVFIALLALAAGVMLCRFRRVFREKQPFALGAMEWALGVSLLGPVLFALSRRADAATYRYLAPVVVVSPFLIMGLHRAFPHRGRLLTGGLAILLALYNLSTATRLTVEWRHPDFARHIVRAPDLTPALAVLREKGIRHAVASHWAAYRINFQAGGAVLCSQPQNERFPGWPIPYKAEVDASTNVAYVLTETIRFLKPSVFERHLRTMGVESDVTHAGDFRIYHDFRAPALGRQVRVAADRVGVAVSESQGQAPALVDGDTGTFWRSARLQREGLWVQFAFDRPMHLGRLVLHYGNHGHDRAPALRITALTDAGWVTLHEAWKGDMDKFAWLNGHPVYGHAQQTVPMDVRSAQALRLEIAQPDARKCWTLAEAMLHETVDQK